MGSCVCSQKTNFSVWKNPNKNFVKFRLENQKVISRISSNYDTNYFNKISKQNWVRILDFLKYKELSEASKVNR